MAKLISVSAYITPLEGVLAASGQRLINVDKILGVKASPSGGAFNINGINTVINYSYNSGNMLQNGKCAISGSQMSHQRNKRQHNMSNCSVDRIDSSKDYTLNNIQLVCWTVNRMKGENTQEELIKWCIQIIKNNGLG